MFADPQNDPDYRVGELEHALLSTAENVRATADTPDAVWLNPDKITEAIGILCDARGRLRERWLAA